MTLFARIGWVCALAASSSVLLTHLHPFGDAGLYATSTQERVANHAGIPADVRAMLDAKCADCHSSHTRAPVYGRFAPVSWLLERDILEARKEMDLSQWNSYTPEQQDTFRSKILQQAKFGAMPLIQYRIIHWNSHITPADIAVLTQWAHPPAAPDASTRAVVPGDPERGRAVFERRCTGCHSLERNIEGPRLGGVYGRPTAAITGFPYSAALRNAYGVWNEQTLDRWLTEPDSFVTGNNMDFRVPKAQERLDLITFFAKSAR